MRLLSSGRFVYTMFIAAFIISTSTPTLAQEATPSPTPTGPNVTFLDMLGLVPDVLGVANPPQSQLVDFADVALQLEAVDATAPSSQDDPALSRWIRATRWMLLPPDAANRAFDPGWREVFGFDVFQIDQSLVAGEPPNMMTFLRGRFDQNEVAAALTKSGYTEVDVSGLQAYSLFEDATIDLQNPVSQLALAKMNNAVFLSDGTLAFASTLDGIREIVAVANGEANSLADRLDVSSLVNAMPRQLASATLVPGSALALDGMLLGRSASPGQVQDLLAEIEQLGQMPPITLGLFGVSPGGPLPQPLENGTPEASPVPDISEPAAYEIGLLTVTPGDARTAEQVVVARVDALSSPLTQRPYAEMFTSVTPAGPANLPIAVLELTFSEEVTPAIWAQLIYQRDLLFVGW
jgi:hypothetical protein